LRFSETVTPKIPEKAKLYLGIAGSRSRSALPILGEWARRSGREDDSSTLLQNCGSAQENFGQMKKHN
jgi:hypothetical protein